MALSNVIQIALNFSTRAFTKEGKNTAMVLAPHKISNERIFQITAADDLVDDYGLSTDDPLYKWALAYFSQNPSPTQLSVGRIQVDTVKVTPTAENLTNYDVKINGVWYRYTSDGSALVAEITAGLETIINNGYSIAAVSQINKTFSIAGDLASLFTAGMVIPIDGSTGNDGYYTVVSATYSAPNTVITVEEAIPDSTADGSIKDPDVTATDQTTYLDIASSVAGTAWTLAVGDEDLLEIDTINASDLSETIAQALAAIALISPDWYALGTTLRDSTSQLAIAAYVQANDKLGVLSSNTSAIVNSTKAADTTSIAYTLYNSNYTRTALFYHPDAADANSLADECMDAAVLGKYLPSNPGSMTLANQQLTGISGYTLTQTQKNNATDKYCNIFDVIAGLYVIREGKTSGNEFIDIIRDTDTLKQEIQEALEYFLTVQRASQKVPYTDKGIGAIENIVRGVMQENTVNPVTGYGILAEFDSEQGDYFTATPASEMSVIDRANRVYGGIEFKRRVAGAIHTISITGYIGV